MLLNINSDNPDERKIKQVIECLQDGGIIIYPTDTVYGIGCDITKFKAIEKICQIKGVKVQKANLSFICYDLSQLADFTLPFNKSIYKLMNRNLPGPFTFILKGNNNLPKFFKKKKTVGIRVPDNNIARTIVRELGNPLLSTSLKIEDDISEYLTDPYEIHETFENLVDIVIDGGYGDNRVSTVIDCTNNEIEIIREGKGELIQ
ncbi:MAG: L-threonylcarbamoyladenylate synthase [Chitinophagales bacterium]